MKREKRDREERNRERKRGREREKKCVRMFDGATVRKSVYECVRLMFPIKRKKKK